MSIDQLADTYSLSLIIVQSGMGSQVLQEAKSIGVRGGTIVLAKGTVKSRALKILGLDEARREIVVIVSSSELEPELHRHLSQVLETDKPNHGIIVSLPVRTVVGTRPCAAVVTERPTGGSGVSYQTIFTIVERGLGEEVVAVAEQAGSRGATIINARGSGVHEKSTFFGMIIEPEKEIVMIIIESERAPAIVQAIETKMQLGEPGKGILFAMDATRVSGLFSSADKD